jgi:hypothetical protein
MPTAQGIKKVVSYKKQTGLASPASGSGGQKLRRRTFTFNKPTDSYSSDEIVSHQQSTGVSIGPAKPQGKLDGLLSPGTYSDWLASLLRRDFAAVTAVSGASITIAGSGPTYTVTRAAGSFITDGVKAGMVVRLTAGAFNAANLNKNLQVISLTATALTVKSVNGVALVAEGPITSATVSIPGKYTFVPSTGHSDDYYTVEQYFADIGKSETFPDAQVSKAEISFPASGNATIGVDLVALARVLGSSQVLTSPAADTTTDPLAAVTGVMMVGGSVVGVITAASVSIDGQVTHGDPTIGSNAITETQSGVVKVTGQIAAKFTDTSLQAIRESGAATSIVLTVAEDQTAAADFVTFIIPAAKLTSDDADDGMKAIVRTYAFEAAVNAGGGAGAETSIIAIQDSAAF